MKLETKIAIALLILVIVDVLSTWFFVVRLNRFTESQPLGFNFFTVAIAIFCSLGLLFISTKVDEWQIKLRMVVLTSLAVALSWRLCVIIDNLFLVLNHFPY